MRKFCCVALAVAGPACTPGVLPVLPTVSFVVPVPPPPAVVYPLDGQWVLADVDGRRSCLVIQESRVAIVNSTCRLDGGGFASRIIESPRISRAGQEILLSVTYNPVAFDPSFVRLSFSGTVQVDGTFIGTRIETLIDTTELDPRIGPKETTRVIASILSRS